MEILYDFLDFLKVFTVAGQTTVHGRLALKPAQTKAQAM